MTLDLLAALALWEHVHDGAIAAVRAAWEADGHGGATMLGWTLARLYA